MPFQRGGIPQGKDHAELVLQISSAIRDVSFQMGGISNNTVGWGLDVWTMQGDANRLSTVPETNYFGKQAKELAGEFCWLEHQRIVARFEKKGVFSLLSGFFIRIPIIQRSK